jgi:hypothetical protein
LQLNRTHKRELPKQLPWVHPIDRHESRRYDSAGNSASKNGRVFFGRTL